MIAAIGLSADGLEIGLLVVILFLLTVSDTR